MLVIHTHAKDQGQRSVGFDAQIDGGDCITSSANAVSQNYGCFSARLKNNVTPYLRQKCINANIFQLRNFGTC